MEKCKSLKNYDSGFIEGRTRVENLLLPCESPRHLNSSTKNKNNKTSTYRGENESITISSLLCISPTSELNNQKQTNKLKQNEGRTTTQ